MLRPWPTTLSRSLTVSAVTDSAARDEALATANAHDASERISNPDHGGHLPARHGSARKGLRQTIGHRQAAPETKWSFHGDLNHPAPHVPAQARVGPCAFMWD